VDTTPVTILYYQTPTGRCPFREWLHSLDASMQGIIDARLIRIRRGLFGDVKPVGGGVFELRFDVGPGYCVYGGRDGKALVILLHGGEKKGQSHDIVSARELWEDYLRRTRR
jgi:putative addiction module killer protein